MNPSEITLELRATAPRAPEALRQRVAAIAADEPERRGRLLRLPAAPRRHRAAFALAAVLVVAVGSALVAGLLGGSGGHKNASHFENQMKDTSLPTINNHATAGGGSAAGAGTTPAGMAAAAPKAANPGALQHQKSAARAFQPATIPASLRLQDYQVYLGVRVKDEDALSKATVQAM